MGALEHCAQRPHSWRLVRGAIRKFENTLAALVALPVLASETATSCLDLPAKTHSIHSTILQGTIHIYTYICKSVIYTYIYIYIYIHNVCMALSYLRVAKRFSGFAIEPNL